MEKCYLVDCCLSGPKIPLTFPSTLEAKSGSLSWYKRFIALQSLCPQTIMCLMSFTTHPSSRAAGSQLKYSSWKCWAWGIRLPAFRTYPWESAGMLSHKLSARLDLLTHKHIAHVSVGVPGGNHSTVHAGEEDGLGLNDKVYQY